jgi:hypothetical protein
MVLLSETGQLATEGNDVVFSKKESVTFSSLDQTSNESYDMLHRLVRLFPSDDGRSSERNFQLISGLDLSPPFDTLLFHEEHLTGVMERRHGGVSVKVLTSRCLSDSLYCRRILLQAPSGKFVTYAVLLANLDNLPDAVRVGVQEEKIPFGRFESTLALSHGNRVHATSTCDAQAAHGPRAAAMRPSQGLLGGARTCHNPRSASPPPSSATPSNTANPATLAAILPSQRVAVGCVRRLRAAAACARVRGQVEFDAGLGLDPAHFLQPEGGGGGRGGGGGAGGGGGGGGGGEAAAGGGGGRRVTYGRTVVIECNGRPAAEVLEVVVP